MFQRMNSGVVESKTSYICLFTFPMYWVCDHFICPLTWVNYEWAVQYIKRILVLCVVYCLRNLCCEASNLICNLRIHLRITFWIHFKFQCHSSLVYYYRLYQILFQIFTVVSSANNMHFIVKHFTSINYHLWRLIAARLYLHRHTHMSLLNNCSPIYSIHSCF